MSIHTCPECGLTHDQPVTPSESPEVAIARITNEAQVRIAEINARADRAVAKEESEAAVEVAKEESDAVEAAMADQEADEHVTDAIQAAAVGLVPDAEPQEPAPEPEPEPVVQVADVHEDAPPPKEEHHESEEEEPREPKRRGLGMW